MCLLHHTDDARNGCLLAGLPGPEAQDSLLEHRSCQHLRTTLFQHRGRLTRNHTLVDIGSVGCHETGSLPHLAINRQALAGSYLQQVAIGNG